MSGSRPDSEPDFKALFEALIASHADLVSRYDHDGRLIFVSDAYATFFGMAASDLVGTSIYSLITSEERKGTRQRLERVSPATPSVSGRNKVSVQGGMVRHVEWVTTGIFDPHGNLLEFMSVGRDVTSFRDVRERLTESETRYAQAVKIAQIGYWMWDEHNDRLDHCSAEAAAIYGVTVEQAMQRSASLDGNMASVHDQDRQRYREVIDNAFDDRKGYDVTFRCYRPNGELRYLREVAEPLFEEDGSFNQTIGTIQDVTEQKLVEQELHAKQALLHEQVQALQENEKRLEAQSQSLKELAESLDRTRRDLEIANEQKNRLFSIIAHDLKSPFTPLLGFSEMLASSTEDMPRETMRDYAQSIHQTAQQANTLLSDLLDWSRLQLERMVVEPTPLELQALAFQQAAQFEELAKAMRINLTVGARGQPASVLADGRIVETVLRNLLSNAIKFTPEGGCVSIGFEGRGALVELHVHDSGTGIPDDVLRDLFTPGPVTTHKGTRGEKGTGLGLMLCKDLIERHGSELCIARSADGGTRVSFSLPAITQN
jgi:PAS domain S-box-containing protein